MYAMILKEGNDLERGAGYAMMGMSLDPLWQLLFTEDATNGIQSDNSCALELPWFHSLQYCRKTT